MRMTRLLFSILPPSLFCFFLPLYSSTPPPPLHPSSTPPLPLHHPSILPLPILYPSTTSPFFHYPSSTPPSFLYPSTTPPPFLHLSSTPPPPLHLCVHLQVDVEKLQRDFEQAHLVQWLEKAVIDRLKAAQVENILSVISMFMILYTHMYMACSPPSPHTHTTHTQGESLTQCIADLKRMAAA